MSKRTKKEKKDKYVRASKHTLKFTNPGKLERYDVFIDEYRRVAEIFLDRIWNKKLIWKDGKKVSHILDIQSAKYDISNHMDYKIVKKHKSWFSARMLSSLSNQVLSAIKSSIDAQSRRLYMLKKLSDNKEEIPFHLLENILKGEPRKPNAKSMNPELSSKNMDFKEVHGEFDMFVRLKCLGEDLDGIKIPEINIPIKMHRQANKWKNCSKRLGSVLFTKQHVELRWEFDKPKKDTGITVGGDQGIRTILTLSDGQTTPECDPHGHTLSSVLKKLSGRKKGGKNFNKTQKHRDNLLNFSLNKLDLSKIKQFNLEEIIGLNSGKHTSAFMKGWTYAFQDQKVESICDEAGVQLHYKASTCKSQRCSCCGWVHEKNRNKKLFACQRCGASLDADLNGSRNNQIDLPDVKDFIMATKLNKKSGFYWKPDGLFGIDGKELGVPNAQKILNNVK